MLLLGFLTLAACRLNACGDPCTPLYISARAFVFPLVVVVPPLILCVFSPSQIVRDVRTSLLEEARFDSYDLFVIVIMHSREGQGQAYRSICIRTHISETMEGYCYE